MLRRLVINKKSLVIIPVALALVLTGLFLPAREVSIEPYGMLSLESKITISIGYEVAYAADAWRSPTGNVANGWSDPTNPYDENTGTSAAYNIPKKGNWSPYLELTIAEIQCDKVRVWSDRQTTDVDNMEVDVYYSEGWYNIHTGSITVGSFVEFAIGSTQAVTSMRVRYYNSHTGQNRFAYVNEADFNELPPLSNAPPSKDFGNVTTSTSYWSNGSAPTFPLDDGECLFEVTNNSPVAVDIDIRSTDFSGGAPAGWTLAGAPAGDTVTLKAGKSGDTVEGDMVTLTTGDLPFIAALAGGSSTKRWELKMETPTSFSNYDPKTATITLTATLSP